MIANDLFARLLLVIAPITLGVVVNASRDERPPFVPRPLRATSCACQLGVKHSGVEAKADCDGCDQIAPRERERRGLADINIGCVKERSRERPGASSGLSQSMPVRARLLQGKIPLQFVQAVVRRHRSEIVACAHASKRRVQGALALMLTVDTNGEVSEIEPGAGDAALSLRRLQRMNAGWLFMRLLAVLMPIAVGIIATAAREVSTRVPLEKSRPSALKVLAIKSTPRRPCRLDGPLLGEIERVTRFPYIPLTPR